SRPCAAEGRRDRRQCRRQEVGRRPHRRSLRDGRELTPAALQRGFRRNGINASSRLGRLPLPLAGEGWGGGVCKRFIIWLAPSRSLPRKRGRERCGTFHRSSTSDGSTSAESALACPRGSFRDLPIFHWKAVPCLLSPCPRASNKPSCHRRRRKQDPRASCGPRSDCCCRWRSPCFGKWRCAGVGPAAAWCRRRRSFSRPSPISPAPGSSSSTPPCRCRGGPPASPSASPPEACSGRSPVIRR